MTSNEARIYELENALESLLDCFDEQVGKWYVDIETDQGDGYVIINDKAAPALAEALDKASAVLYHDDQLEFDFNETENLPEV